MSLKSREAMDIVFPEQNRGHEKAPPHPSKQQNVTSNRIISLKKTPRRSRADLVMPLRGEHYGSVVCDMPVARACSARCRTEDNPEGPTIKNNQSHSKFSISIEVLNLARNCQSRRLEFPTKNRAVVGGSLENSFSLDIFNLARNLECLFDLWALWELSVLEPCA